ncbi:MAG: hypothetical protein F6J93_15025 [Oscillatoria sp. SIO1A7]|nr:hypothetical protein [Oscillatoria sp. SIO1A7]
MAQPYAIRAGYAYDFASEESGVSRKSLLPNAQCPMPNPQCPIPHFINYNF